MDDIILLSILIFKQTAGVSAAFILMNSIAGIAGHLADVKSLPDAIYPLAFAAILGGIIGSRPGSKGFANPTLNILLAAVLVIAGVKFIFV